MITTSDIELLLQDGLSAIFGGYPIYKNDYLHIVDVYKATKNFEKEVEVRLLGPASYKPEGQAGKYGDMAQTYEYSYQILTMFSGFVMSQESIDDDLYKTQFPQTALSLKNSMADAKNIAVANLLNLGFDPMNAGGDGVPLFSTQHPVQGGFVSNTFSIPEELSETSLTKALTAIMNFRGSNGSKVVVKPLKLIVPPALWAQAKVLIESKFSPDTANNAINAVESAIPQGYRISNYLTNPTAWFVKTDAPNSLKLYEKQALKINYDLNIDTYAMKVNATERYAVGRSDFRGIFGSQGI